MLHRIERVTQLSNLIIMLDDRQRGREVSFGNLTGRDRQLAQGLGGPFNDHTTGNTCHQQGKGNQHKHNHAQAIGNRIDHDSGNDRGYTPSGMLDRLIENVYRPEIAIEKLERRYNVGILLIISTSFACHHLTAYVIIDGVFRRFGKIEIILLDNEVLIGVGDVSSILVDDKFLRHTSPVDV